MLKTFDTGQRAVASPRIWAEVDLALVQANVRRLRSRLPAGCELMAVVKAEAYGHGAVPVARAALAAGASRLGVADVAEGCRLRQAGIRAPIHLLGPVTDDELAQVAEQVLVPAICDRAQLSLLAQAVLRRHHRRLPSRLETQRDAVPLPFEYELELDTGMARHGIDVDQALAWADAAAGDRSQSALVLAGLFTHFCAVDATGRDSMRGQWHCLSAVHRRLQRAGHRLRHHACNTLGLSVLPEACADVVRIGGGIYGLGAVSGLGVEPVLTLKTRVVGVRNVPAGTPVGYGSVWRSTVPTRLLLLPCGYADGLSKSLWQGGEVLVRGRRRRIAGVLSMNQTVVDAGPGDDVQIGDEVVLLGAQGEDRVFAEDRVVAGGSAYEVTTALRLEMPRRYRNGGSGSAVGDRPHAR